MAATIFTIVSTKGGTAKTTLSANLSGILADIGLRVLMIDADVQPSLSKYFPLSKRAKKGMVELLLNDNSTEEISSTISSTIYPNLDIVLSNNITNEIQIQVQNLPQRAFLLKSKLNSPFIQENYDVIIIDTQGAVGALQDAASFAANHLISPIMPDVLSAREFFSGTQTTLKRLADSTSAMGLPMPSLIAVIHGRKNTNDSAGITEEIQKAFNQGSFPNSRLLETTVPYAKAYTEAASARTPVHAHEPKARGKAKSAYEVMENIVYEIFPKLKELNVKPSFFKDEDGNSIVTAKEE